MKIYLLTTLLFLATSSTFAQPLYVVNDFHDIKIENLRKSMLVEAFVLTGERCQSLTAVEINSALACVSMEFAPKIERSVAQGLNEGLAELNKSLAGTDQSYVYKVTYREDAQKGLVITQIELKQK